MKLKREEIILHPLRMQIIQALLHRPMTPAELLAQTEASQATLYRHLQLLEDHSIIYPLEKRPARGAVEKTYAIEPSKASFSAADTAAWSKDDHLHALTLFTGQLILQASDYLDSENLSPEKDGYGFHQVDMQLEEEEWHAFLQEYAQLIQKYHQKSTDSGRRYTAAGMLIPEKKRRDSHGTA
ncbi:helix-turn-helix domain-containing protein [Alkalicoccus urumqiensis]|uniref:HTH arsR-type domain-containing protein n=1 Tax=Alkalicoccus urumqiensis TaxID=1548213 RepID=A0A2P6MDF2_ALKUR|nr:helix-turn-helix domain-containing protein [Alkalicoccus urumqiensis]PRO64294.1 hypothetical protein C6I21_15600 [Alkalicoccus urumqiensis]